MCVSLSGFLSLRPYLSTVLNLRGPSQPPISGLSPYGAPPSPSLSASFLLHHLLALQAPACSPQALLSRAAPWGEAQAPPDSAPPWHPKVGGDTAWSWLGWREQQPGDPGPGDMEKGKQTDRHPERRWEKRDEKGESFKTGKKRLNWRMERARETRRGQKEIRREEKRKDSPANKGGRWKNCTQAWRKGERRDSWIKGTEEGHGERRRARGEGIATSLPTVSKALSMGTGEGPCGYPCGPVASSPGPGRL